MGIKNALYRTGNAALGVGEYGLYIGFLDMFGEKIANNPLYIIGTLVMGGLISSEMVTRVFFNKNLIQFSEYCKQQEIKEAEEKEREKLTSHLNLELKL